MNFVSYDFKEVTTKQELQYAGQHLSGEVSAVVILRSGGTLEMGLKRVVPDARIGRLLIQSNSRTGISSKFHEDHELKLTFSV